MGQPHSVTRMKIFINPSDFPSILTGRSQAVSQEWDLIDSPDSGLKCRDYDTVLDNPTTVGGELKRTKAEHKERHTPQFKHGVLDRGVGQTQKCIGLSEFRTNPQ